MRMNLLKACLLLFPLTFCSKKENASGGGGASDEIKYDKNTACIQGVVMNGITGHRIKLPTGTSSQGVFVRWRDHLIQGTVISTENENLFGEYALCGFPANETWDVHVWLDSYLPFYGEVMVDNTVTSDSPQATLDLDIPYPTHIANIRLYQKATSTQDFVFTVLSNGVPVENALVQIKPKGTNYLDSGSFLQPKSERLIPLANVSDASGNVTISKDVLVLGAIYDYLVLAPDTGKDMYSAKGTFTLGLANNSSTPASSDPYQYYVDLKYQTPSLVLLSSSDTFKTLAGDGVLKLYFNRPFEIVPKTKDNIVATLAGAVTATLKTNETGNEEAETVDVSISGNTLTLTPKFETSPNAKDDINMAITYSGITLRATTGPETTIHLAVPAKTLYFYKAP